MEKETTDCDNANEVSEFMCLQRVGKKSDWIHLPENSPTSLGRGVGVSCQLMSTTCPLMISRLHCVFSLKEGQWIVTDNKTLNGVWVNGHRIPAFQPHPLQLGDSVQLGVPSGGHTTEFDYVLARRPAEEMKFCMARQLCEKYDVNRSLKRKMTTEELEPSTSVPKLYRSSSADKTLGQPCPQTVQLQRRVSPTPPEETGPSSDVQEGDGSLDGNTSSCDLDNLHRYSQNILMLMERFSDTQRQVDLLEAERHPEDSLKEAQCRVLQGQLNMLQAKMDRMKELESRFSETERKIKEQKTRQQMKLLKNQLEEALQEQKKVIEELSVSRQGFEETLSAKNKELEVTKKEKEKARAQKEEVVTQVTEILENELQCIICSELFIEAVILNCAHSFCRFCIQSWRKKKDECPICRREIQSQNRCLALDNCIDGMVDNLSAEMKARRQSLVAQRNLQRT